MTSEDRKKKSSAQTRRKDRAAEIANTFEWLITAFILAFLFRAFVMEAFRIPTGSMADTLKGAHFRLRCYQCGYKYDYGLGNFRIGRDSVPRGYISPMSTRCPSCGWFQQTGGEMSVSNGDRILVLKCIYQFFEPRRWDVVVFKNPTDPTINYIKRLVGRPGETIEIIDGDVYVNGRISRKPPKVQNELWMPVYDNDYQPVRRREPFFNNHPWDQPFRNVGSSQWEIDRTNPMRFRLNSPADQINTMSYSSRIGNSFHATYAYDDARQYNHAPYCSDLMVRLYARFNGSKGLVGVELSKYGIKYKAWRDSAGQMVIAKVANGTQTPLTRRSGKVQLEGKPVLVRFANVDHELVFEFGGEKLVWDLGRGPEDAGPRALAVAPEAKIFGAGALTVSNVAVFRDIHYASKRYANNSESGRATEGRPFELADDEFFVLGDNSPNSEDSRWWSSQGKGNNETAYRQGIVPRDYLVGKALFVYWPSGFRPHRGFPIGFIPNIGQMRFIYGGSSVTEALSAGLN
ncbi:MAG: signal peptidase I [Planctomycetota bacterium]|jgi:signal peptidase I